MSCQISVWCEVLILVTEPDLCSIFFQIKLIGFSKVAGNAVLPSHFELPMWPVTPWRFVMDVISPRMMWQKPLECFPDILSNLSVGITSIPTTTRFCTSQVDFSWFEPPSTVAKLQTSNDSAKRCRSERSTFWLSVKSLRTLLHCVLQDNAGHIGLRYIKGRNNGPVKTSKKKNKCCMSLSTSVFRLYRFLKFTIFQRGSLWVNPWQADPRFRQFGSTSRHFNHWNPGPPQD